MPRLFSIIIIHSNEPCGAHFVLCSRASFVEFVYRLLTGLENVLMRRGSGPNSVFLVMYKLRILIVPQRRVKPNRDKRSV